MSIKKKDIICIIPARGGSKGLKKKNLLKINGKPLIAHTIKFAQKTNLIGSIIVSTDDRDIAKISKKNGAIVPFVRPKSLSGDLSTTEETLKHALLSYEKLTKKKFKICIYLSPTDIFRNLNWIKKAIKILNEKRQIESVFVGHQTHKNYWEFDKKNKAWKRIKAWMKVYSSRQIRRKIVREDTGLTCVSRSYLWRKGKRIGDKVEILINQDSFSSIDIHDKHDFELASFALKIKKYV